MNATATKRQTAGNNELLARVKKIFNAKVYAKALAEMNGGRGVSGVCEVLKGVVDKKTAEGFVAGYKRA